MAGKKGISAILGAIAAVVFSVVMFMLWPVRDGVFWLTYLFILFGIIAVTANIAAMKSGDRHFAANQTLVTISVVYLIACAVASLIGAAWLRMRATGYFALHIILFAVFLCIWIVARGAVSYINKQD